MVAFVLETVGHARIAYDTLVISLPDSVRLVVRDTLRAVVPIPANDLSWIKDAAVPLAAALLGAVVGGWMSRQAAFEAQAKAADATRRERVEAQAEENAQLLRELLRVFVYDVKRVETIPDSLEHANQKIGPLMPTLKDHIDQMCQGYFGRRESLFFLEDRALQDEIESFYSRLLTLRGWIVAWNQEEAAFRLAEHALPDTTTPPSVVIKSFAVLAATGRELAHRLHRAHPTFGLEAATSSSGSPS